MRTNMESKPAREETEKAAATWLLRRSNPQWSDADQAELEQWLATSPGHRVSYIRLESIWADTERLKSIASGFPKGKTPPRGAIEQSPFFTIKQTKADQIDLQSEEFFNSPGPDNAPLPPASEVPSVSISKERRRGVRPFAIAASLLLIIAAGITIYSVDRAGRGQRYNTSIGGLSTVPTSDGSIITLNTNSEIEVRFTDHERRIELKKGEGFFEVAKDPARPFAVYADHQRVVAVGTKFSVRLNPDTLHVAVTEGKVRLEDRAGGSDNLVAGTVADIENRHVSLKQRPLSEIQQTLSWRAGYIVLDGTPLTEAVAEFNRYNTRQLIVGDASLGTLKVEGNFRSNNLDGFVRLLEQGFEVQAGGAGDGRILLSKKN